MMPCPHGASTATTHRPDGTEQGYWRFRDRFSLWEVVETCLPRGMSLTHEAVRAWEGQLAPLLTEAWRKKRRGAVGNRWYGDETSINVPGQ